MKTLPKSAMNKLILCLLVILVYGMPALLDAAITVDTRQHKILQLTVGNSITIRSSKAISRISIAEPKIADFVMISPSQVYLTGKLPGSSTLTIWEGKNHGDRPLFNGDRPHFNRYFRLPREAINRRTKSSTTG